MKIKEVVAFLETVAPVSLQENYDNAGLITGNSDWECKGIICALDATEEVVLEALGNGCNLIVAHHPIIFKGLKKINGKDYVEKAIIAAIKHDIAIYAIHTNLDNMIDGVNGRMALMLGLENCRVLSPRANSLKKLFTFVPEAQAGEVRDALFAAGAGQIGNYSECSFNTEGTGTFKPGLGAQPFSGTPGERQYEKEIRLEVIFPSYLQSRLVEALKQAHPYEEVAFELVSVDNAHTGIGSGLIGNLPKGVTEAELLTRIKTIFDIPFVRHSPFLNREVKTVAICGGAGSFLITNALQAGADVFVTSDVKYHEFFDANGRMLIADIGHFESEQFTVNLLQEIFEQKFPTFAVLKTAIRTNPVHYY